MNANSSTPPATVLLGCSKCGASLPEDAQFCLKCGKPVSAPAKNETVVEVLPPVTPPPPRRKPRLVFWILLAVLIALILWVATSDSPTAQGFQEAMGWKHDQTILDSSFTVSAHSFRYYKFSLPEGSLNVAVVGEFSSAADSRANAKLKGEKDKADAVDNDIQVYVLSEAAFTIWQNGYATASVYDSGQVSQGKVQTEVPAGAGIYYLVFNNKFSPKTPKSVQASVLLRYKSWLPGWFRRMKERFWNWVES